MPQAGLHTGLFVWQVCRSVEYGIYAVLNDIVGKKERAALHALKLSIVFSLFSWFFCLELQQVLQPQQVAQQGWL